MCHLGIFLERLMKATEHVTLVDDQVQYLSRPLQNITGFQNIFRLIFIDFYRKRLTELSAPSHCDSYKIYLILLGVTNLKSTVSIPVGINELFNWHNSSGHTESPWPTQPLRVMSTRKVSRG